MSKPDADQLFVVYDARAITEGTEDATVLSAAGSLEGARRDALENGYPCAIYGYDVDRSTKPPTLINERFIEPAPPTRRRGRGTKYR
jgi:hypothetical protein